MIPRRGSTWVIIVITIALLVAGVLLPIPKASFELKPIDPSWRHPLGLSPYGHDMLLLTLAATVRVAAQAVWATLLTVVIAVLIGALAAWNQDGIFDRLQTVAGRLFDSLGIFLIAICLATLATRLTIWQLAPALAFFAWPNLSHIVRAEIAAMLRIPFVEAARAIGVPRVRLFFVHLLPFIIDRILPPALVMIGAYVAVFGALQFLGAGISGEPSLGFMLYDASQNFLRTAPWYFGASFGGFAVILLITASLGTVAYARLAPRTRDMTAGLEKSSMLLEESIQP